MEIVQEKPHSYLKPSSKIFLLAISYICDPQLLLKFLYLEYSTSKQLTTKKKISADTVMTYLTFLNIFPAQTVTRLLYFIIYIHRCKYDLRSDYFF